jgi:hypothetical protein
MFDLSGKVAIVTGSTKGIGRAMVSGLAAAGASVVVSSRKQELCDSVADEVQAESGGEVLGLACHVGDWDAIPAFVDAVVARFGRIDVLVNNAGINPAPVTTSQMTLEYWRKVFAVNLEGPLRMSQCVAPIMRDGRTGQSDQEQCPGVGVVAGTGQRPESGAIRDRDGRGCRSDSARLQGSDRGGHHDATHRRPRRDRRSGAVPRQRCFVLRHRRRHFGLGRNDEVTLAHRREPLESSRPKLVGLENSSNPGFCGCSCPSEVHQHPQKHRLAADPNSALLLLRRGL